MTKKIDDRIRCWNCSRRYYKKDDYSYYCSDPESSSVGVKEITTDMALCNRKCASFIKAIPEDKQPKKIIVEFEVDTSKVGRTFMQHRLEMDFSIVDEYIKLKSVNGPREWV
jgi:hypothetical protein